MLPGLACFPRLAWLRWGERFPRAGRLFVVLVRAVHGSAGGELTWGSLLSGRGRSRKSAGLAPAAFAACAAASMATTAPTSPAASASLAAVTALHSIATHLALLSALALLARRFNAGARLAAW